MAGPSSPDEIRAAWRRIAVNYDHAVSSSEARDFLVGLNANRFDQSPWRDALDDRRRQAPEFFAAFPYHWCDAQDSFDFPIEATYQVRTLDAAVGLWRAPIEDKPKDANFDRIVARATFLPKFRQATPHVQESDGYRFVVCPLGWLEFIQRYFAAFAKAWPPADGRPVNWAAACHADWLGIAANMVASAVNQYDYFLPQMIAAIVREVPAFSSAPAHFSEVTEAPFSQDLSYAAHDFALCHEVSHIVAGDFNAPDELRADRWAVAAYFSSAELRLPLHGQLVTLGPLRSAIGPFAFGSALRSLLAARAFVAKRLKDDPKRIHRFVQTYSAAGARSRLLLSQVESAVERLVTDPHASDYQLERDRRDALFEGLLAYETALGEHLNVVSEDACATARTVAQASEAEALASQ